MAEQNDRQEWDESDESGDERYTALMENQQSDQQMATMAGGQLNLIGPSQLGGGNTQNINPTFNDSSNSNNVVYNNCTFVYNTGKYAPNGNQSQQMSLSYQDEGDQQLPRLSDNPPSGRLTEQCLQHMHNRIQAQSSWTGSRCPTLPDQYPPTPSQPVATGSSQTPVPTPSSCPKGQSQMTQINDGILRSRLASQQPVSPQPSSTDIQSTPTETPDSVKIVDKCGKTLQPGDCVWVEPDRCSGYPSIYVGGLDLIRCTKKTQRVKMEMINLSQQFIRRTPFSSGQCRIFSAETRVDRARYCVGRVSPVTASWWGEDFVYWTWTGLGKDQAWEEGFFLC